MRCDQTIELLPWLLNGTLGKDEQEEVRQHLTTCPSCRQALADTQQAWQIFDQHIPAADLVAWAAGDVMNVMDAMEESRSAELAAHLASCPECTAELELARTSRALMEDNKIVPFPSPPPRPAPAPVVRPAAGRWKAAALAAGLAGLIAANGWYQTAERARTLAGRLTETPAAAPSAPSAPAGAVAAVPPQEQQNVAELQSRLESMQKTLGELESAEAEHRQQLSLIAEAKPGSAAGPQINTWVGEESSDVVRGSSDIQEVPADAAMATLILRPAADTLNSRDNGRDIEITDTQGKAIWKAQGLRLNPVSLDYSVTFHRGDLAPGDYVIRLYRQDNGQRTAAESYPIRVK